MTKDSVQGKREQFFKKKMKGGRLRSTMTPSTGGGRSKSGQRSRINQRTHSQEGGVGAGKELLRGSGVGGVSGKPDTTWEKGGKSK